MGPHAQWHAEALTRPRTQASGQARASICKSWQASSSRLAVRSYEAVNIDRCHGREGRMEEGCKDSRRNQLPRTPQPASPHVATIIARFAHSSNRARPLWSSASAHLVANRRMPVVTAASIWRPSHYPYTPCAYAPAYPTYEVGPTPSAYILNGPPPHTPNPYLRSLYCSRVQRRRRACRRASR
jgi:hypothetical protein